MNQMIRIRTILVLGLSLGMALVLLGLAAPAQADGGGWPTETFTPSPTNTSAVSPIDQLLTPPPAIIAPDTGGAAISFEDELATVQAEAQMTAAAQPILFNPTATPVPENEGLSPLMMVGGLVAAIILLGVALFVGLRFIRR